MSDDTLVITRSYATDVAITWKEVASLTDDFKSLVSLGYKR